MKQKNNIDLEKTFELAFQKHQEKKFQIAESIYKEILLSDPDHFKATMLLGSLYGETKKFEEAKKLLQKAIQINSSFPEAHYNLGLVYVELKKFEKAIECNERAIQINPNYAEAYNNLGNSLKELGDNDKAISSYKSAILINPNYSDAYNNIGALFQKLKNYKDAINAYQESVKRQPNNFRTYNNLGSIFHETKKYKQAIIHYQKSIQVFSNNIDANYNLGIIFQELGDFKEAINFYEKASTIDSENLLYLYLLGELKLDIFNKTIKDKIIKIINNKECTKKNLSYGNFLLSNFKFKEENYEEEFNYLIQAHHHYFESEKDKFVPDINYWLNILPAQNELFGLNQVNTDASKKNNLIKPIFIVGVPRSGSTLIEKIIVSSTLNIPSGEETGILSTFVKQEIIQEKSFKNKILSAQDEIIEAFTQRNLIKSENDYIFTDKSLPNYYYIGLIKQLFPKAKIINCKRDPLSSIMSIFKNNLGRISWAHNLNNIFKYFEIYYNLTKYYKKNLPGFIYDLEYEKFVENPELESKKLFNFCEIPWDKKCLEFYKNKNLISKTASNIQIRNSINKDSIKKYEPYLQFLEKYKKKYDWFNKFANN